MRKETITIYEFEELPTAVQAEIIEKNHSMNVPSGWWTETYDMSKDLLSLMGIEIDVINFTGFYSQGDGAYFTGNYIYTAGAGEAIKTSGFDVPELIEIANRIQAIQKNHNYTLTANIVKNDNRYCHSNSVDIAVYNTESEELKQCLRDCMDWIFLQLKKEYEYLTSKESIKESIIYQENEYYIDGRII
jgi:hypothetical protein